MEFLFRCRPVTDRGLIPQLSAALEKRTELISRQKYPGMWRHIDYFASMRHSREGFRSARQRRFMGAVMLILGLVLLVPGLVKPAENWILLLCGALGAGFGLFELVGSRRLPRSQFDRAAEHLLATRGLIADDDVRVRFREEGMTLEQGTNGEIIPYAEFEPCFETEDTYLVTYRGLVLLLVKADLTGDPEEFRTYLSRQAELVTVR